MPADEFSLLPAVEHLGRAFRSHGFHLMADGLGVYWKALRGGLHADARIEFRWSAIEVARWSTLIELEVRGAGLPCFRCRSPKGEVRSANKCLTQFPGGRHMQCMTCRCEWLESLSGPSRSKR